MYKTVLAILGILIFSQTMAQKAAVTWGEDFKMKRGSNDLSVIHVDGDAVYIEEGHITLRTFFVLASTGRESATLVKLNKNLEELYRNNFNTELKKRNFDRFFFLQDKLFMLATGFNNKNVTLFAIEINKADGQVKGDWVELTRWEKQSKKEKLQYNVDYNGDSTRMIIVSTIEGKETHEYGLLQFDTDLKQVGKTVTIHNSFERNTFQLEDIVYTNNGNIVMVARELEYREGKKKKAKFLDFKNYVVLFYNPAGKLIQELNTGIHGKFLISSKISQIDGKELVLAAFYSNTKRGKKTDGMLVQRIDAATGAVVSTSMKELNTAMISNTEPDEDETSKERKERERLEKLMSEEEGFTNDLRFRNFIPTPDGGLVIMAEEYRQWIYYEYFASSNGRMVSKPNIAFLSGDIMMSKVDASGNMEWLHVLPKSHREDMPLSGFTQGWGTGIGSRYWANSYSFPFYSGFASIRVGNTNTVAILFNDGVRNADVLHLGQKIKRTSRFGKSDFNYVQLDATTGKYTRTQLFNNSEVPTATPRLGSSFSNVFYMIGKQDRALAKTKIAVAKIVFN